MGTKCFGIKSNNFKTICGNNISMCEEDPNVWNNTKTQAKYIWSNWKNNAYQNSPNVLPVGILKEFLILYMFKWLDEIPAYIKWRTQKDTYIIETIKTFKQYRNRELTVISNFQLKLIWLKPIIIFEWVFNVMQEQLKGNEEFN